MAVKFDMMQRQSPKVCFSTKWLGWGLATMYSHFWYWAVGALV